MNVVRGDSWTIALPGGWKAPETLENGTVYLDSFDESKGIYVTTWRLAPDEAATSLAAAESRKDADVEALHQMEGYVWELVDERVEAGDTGVAVVFADHLAEASEYRIATAVLARLPIVVRAAFHDYNCSDYAASAEYFAPIVQSLSLVADEG